MPASAETEVAPQPAGKFMFCEKKKKKLKKYLKYNIKQIVYFYV